MFVNFTLKMDIEVALAISYGRLFQSQLFILQKGRVSFKSGKGLYSL